MSHLTRDLVLNLESSKNNESETSVTKTNKVRCIVHQKCNIVIGHAGDDTKILQGAIQYLNKHKQ